MSECHDVVVLRRVSLQRLGHTSNLEITGNFFFAGARIFFQSLEAAIFLFSRVARIPEGSLVLPAICTEERITLGAELVCLHSVHEACLQEAAVLCIPQLCSSVPPTAVYNVRRVSVHRPYLREVRQHWLGILS